MKPVPHFDQILAEMTVEEWLELREISEGTQKEYPNAKAAAEIINSPLYKALK